tara:strand:- start:2 stop:268 length:267 start_codon:yes stop_codon:yes gene_type:complete
MALEKITEDDKLEIVAVSSWKVLQVRTATIIKDDGVEISRTFERKVIMPTDDWSSESDEIKEICNLIMTSERIAAYKAALPENPDPLV